MVNWYKNYTGYVREGFTYATYPFRPRAKPTKKFVIFTVGRSGSGLLVNLLHSHAHIHCDDELFQRALFSPLSYLRCKERLSRRDVYGFKLNTYHFRIQQVKDPLQFVGAIHDAGYRMIGLKRRNLLRQVISHMFALHRNVFHQRSPKYKRPHPPFIVTLDRLQKELALFESYRATRDQIQAHFPSLEVYYEDDLSDSTKHQATIDKVAGFLDVPPARVQTSFSKTTPRELSSFVANFDQVSAFLRKTEYAQYLEMD